ncbi:DUF421 domain-containing protein [Ruminococcus sp.]|uniref:DUF421 domain-containing protein n=1 Tax=Ruminococcus sp. TaxID=41978 RepID=UPI0025D27C03|nr:DUF421 domain-containing protein [Ruminococcus sp.]MBQ8965469.1 DUF421 domain-containing protein [Ruminococcus sp.]
MLIVFIRAFVLYFVIVAAVRLMGKRQIGEMQPSELVVTILLSNIATLPVEDISIPMTMGIVPVFTLVAIDVIISYLSLRYRGVRRAVSGSAKLIISQGKIDQHAMRELRFTNDDLMAALRAQQIFDLDDVQFAVAETTGTISVCPKKAAAPPTSADLGLSPEEKDPPVMVISDGQVSQAALRHLGLDEKWLGKIVKASGADISGVFLMTADSAASYTIVKKEDMK